VTIRELPPFLPRAFVAIEDRRFYSHFGMIRSARSALTANAMRRASPRRSPSAAACQEPVPHQDRTLWRKLQSCACALARAQFSKDEILALYLNRVYFGAGAMGSMPPRSAISAGRQAGDTRPGRDARRPRAVAVALAPSRNPNGARCAADRAVAHGRVGAITEPWPREHSPTRARIKASAPHGVICGRLDHGRAQRSRRHVEQDIVVETSIDPRCRPRPNALVEELNQKGAKFDVEQGAIVAMTPQGAVGRSSAAELRRQPYNRAVAAKRQRALPSSRSSI